jgi:hypothetical protein
MHVFGPLAIATSFAMATLISALCAYWARRSLWVVVGISGGIVAYLVSVPPEGFEPIRRHVTRSGRLPVPDHWDSWRIAQGRFRGEMQQTLPPVILGSLAALVVAAAPVLIERFRTGRARRRDEFGCPKTELRGG